MNILVVLHYAPYPPNSGVSKRNFHLFLEVLKRHEVSVISFGSREEERKFREQYGASCKHIFFINNKRPKIFTIFLRAWLLITGRSSKFRLLQSRKLQKALNHVTAIEQFDLIHCSSGLLGYHGFPAHVPRIGDNHNVEYDNVYRAYQESANPIRKLYYLWEAKKGKADELNNCAKFDFLLATSERDLKIFKKDLPEKKICIIPNGTDLHYFAPQQTCPEPMTMAFTGLMNYYPNDHGALYFLDKIFPLILSSVPGARIFIVGAKPSTRLQRRASENVIITGFVEDVRPFVARAQISVIPILIGGGTRLKALESMAMKKPIVSTTIGCEGINLTHEESALFADTAGDFARAVVRLFDDASLRARLAQQAYANVVEQYGWDAIGRKLDGVYQTLLNNGRASHRQNVISQIKHGDKREPKHTAPHI